MDNQHSASAEYMVSIRCMTYNQASYIEDAMNGFCMQQTDFPFAAVIVDDASTDGEPDVLRRYLQKHFDLDDESVVRNEETDDYTFTFARHRENPNCYFAVYLLKYNHYRIKKDKVVYYQEFTISSKYLATCEGDDYWTAPQKLKMQIDFLESHPDYTMCFHDVEIKVEKGREWYDVFGKLEDRDYTGFENLMKWSVPTCSMVYRRELDKLKPVNSKFTMGDNVLILTCSRYGKLRCIPQKMGVYRLNPTSWNGGSSNKILRYKFISHYYGLMEEFEECRCDEVYDILENQYFQLLTILKREKETEEFEKIKNEYLNYPGTVHWDEFSRYYRKFKYRNIVKSMIPKSILTFLRKCRQN